MKKEEQIMTNQKRNKTIGPNLGQCDFGLGWSWSWLHLVGLGWS